MSPAGIEPSTAPSQKKRVLVVCGQHLIISIAPLHSCVFVVVVVVVVGEEVKAASREPGTSARNV